jgi:surface antigen
VVIGTTPQARGIMEWLFPEKEGFENSGQKGHIAFVEAVFPDGSVRLSEANWPCDGIYNERIMVEAEWKELNPTFISFKPLSHDTYR